MIGPTLLVKGQRHLFTHKGFPKLGITEAMSRTAFTIYCERVGHVLARVEADLGFQQVSEILPVKTFKLVRMLPAELRKPFYFSAAIGAHCTRPDRVARVKQFLRFLASTEAALAIKQTEPGAVASAHLAYGV